MTLNRPTQTNRPNKLQIDADTLISAGTPEYQNTLVFCPISGIPLYQSYDPFFHKAVCNYHWIFTCSERAFREEVQVFLYSRKRFNSRPDAAKLLTLAILYRLGIIEVKNTPIDWKSITISQFNDVLNLWEVIQKYSDKLSRGPKLPKRKISDGVIPTNAIVDCLQVALSENLGEYVTTNSHTISDDSKVSKRVKENADSIEYSPSFWDSLEIEISLDEKTDSAFPKEQRDTLGKILNMSLDKAPAHSETARRHWKKVVDCGFTKNENGTPNFNALVVAKRVAEINNREKQDFAKLFGKESTKTELVEFSTGLYIEMQEYSEDEDEDTTIGEMLSSETGKKVTVEPEKESSFKGPKSLAAALKSRR